MDYRERKYYLVRLYDYNKDIKTLKDEVPSLKVHSPYNHFNKQISVYNELYAQHDREVVNHHIQVMISCKINDLNKLMKFFEREIIDKKSLYDFYYMNITKENCGQ